MHIPNLYFSDIKNYTKVGQAHLFCYYLLVMDIIRKIVRKILSENSELIEERLMNVDDDVDYIYDEYFRSDIDAIEETGIITKEMFKRHNFETSNLKSELSKKADKINPCTIMINVGKNYYSPNGRLISISTNFNAIDFVISDFGGNLSDAIRGLGNNHLAISLKNEFTTSRIKGSIHHELSHWIDDTLHNQHIKKRAIRASELGVGMTKGDIPINADKMEIQGQIHNVVQLKKQYSNLWDTMSFDDLVKLSPTLYTIANELQGDVKKSWKINLLKRMYREGLLGKNMNN